MKYELNKHYLMPLNVFQLIQSDKLYSSFVRYDLYFIFMKDVKLNRQKFDIKFSVFRK